MKNNMEHPESLAGNVTIQSTEGDVFYLYKVKADMGYDEYEIVKAKSVAGAMEKLGERYDMPISVKFLDAIIPGDIIE